MSTAMLALVVVASLVFLAVVAFFVLWRLVFFLRDPVRIVPEGSENIVSAADGFITYVKRVDAGEVPIAVKARKSIRLVEFAGLPVDSRKDGYLIGTYMTEHSVHRNRAPVGGTVVLREHRSAAPFNRSMGRMAANLLFRRTPYDEDCEYLLQNERLTIGIQHAQGSVVTVTQIADLWVNRIAARVAVGEELERGEQYGLIRFGSQCDVFLPAELVDSILVQPGQYVYAGETVLAKARTQEGSAAQW